jgi:tetratricopeptide (TPR) repeat protein
MTSRGWHGVAILACAAGMASKESMVTAPVMVAVFDRVFLFTSFRSAWSARRHLYLGLGATWLLLALLLSTGPRPHSAGFSAGMSPWTYLLNQAPAVVRYLEQSVWPDSLVLLYGWPRQLTLADVWMQALVIVALLVLTTIALWRRPMLGFLGAWFWITLAPTSSIVPIVTEVAAERRMYLPLMALVVLAIVGPLWLWDEIGRRLGSAVPARAGLTIAVILVTLACASLASATVSRNREYASPVTMARTVLARYPTPIAHLSLGRALLAAGQRDEGLMHVRQALPEAPGAHLTLGLHLVTQGKLEEGVAHLQAFVRDQRPILADVVVARALMGEVFLEQERWTEAVHQFQLILETLPGHSVAEHHLANALFSLGRWEDAVAHYQAYLEKEPHDAGALNNLGIALKSMGQVDAARNAFHRAVDIDPAHAAAHHNLANLLFSGFEFDRALVHSLRAVELQPDAVHSRELLGRILLSHGRLTDAEQQFRRVLELDPASTFAREEVDLLRRIRTPPRDDR